MGRRSASLIAALGLMLAGIGAAESLEGHLQSGIKGLSLADAGPIVVFLVRDAEGAAPPEQARTDHRPAAVVRQRGAQFEPRFLTVSVGQDVEMPNDDVIFHNVFSYSAPNDFDLGLYASGKSQTIRFAHPGLVRFYCSIHESMDGLIFVAPSKLHAMPDSNGHFAIPEVPVGTYQVHVWSERLPEIVVPSEVTPGASVSLQIALDASRGGL